MGTTVEHAQECINNLSDPLLMEDPGALPAVTTIEKQRSTLPDQRRNLCARCRRIDLHAMRMRKIPNSLGVQWLELAREDLKRSACPLCQLFYCSSPPTTAKQTSSPDLLKLVSFSSNSAFTQFDQKDPIVKSDIALLAVLGSDGASSLHETGYISIGGVMETSRLISARLCHSTYFDVDLARTWLHYCCTNHSPSCSSTSKYTPKLLKVIDCETECVVIAPPHCTYVALSYVWGPSNNDRKVVTGERSAFPRTIQDSMTVAVQLKFRYLWVDRYCIDEEDKIEKDAQIAQMDSIYDSAALTIIAAAGEEPGYGLPGISGSERTPQKALRIDSLILAQTLPHPHWSLKHSKWATRAWTYQEGIISHRRLIFTKEQVLWECDAMHCAEALKVPLDAMHASNLTRFKAQIPPGAIKNKSPGYLPFEMMRYISEYYERDLTYSTDAVNAIRGILRTFMIASPKTYHICGIPILSNEEVEPSNDTPNAMGQSITRALFWYHTLPGQRRLQFPSWSWAGWQGGKIDSHFYREDWLFSGNFYGIDLSFEDVHGHLHEIPDALQSQERFFSLEKCLRFIHIDAWTIDCEITNLSDTAPTKTTRGILYPGGYHARFTLFSNKHRSLISGGRKVTQISSEICHAKIHLSSSVEYLEHKSYIGILFPRHYEGHEVREFGAAHVLVVESKGEWHERVGCFHIYEEYWSQRELREPNTSPLDGLYGETLVPLSWRDLRGWFEHIPKTRRKLRLG